MHRLPLLAVGYIKIVTHGGLACNSVVASHTKAVSLLWAPGPIGAGQCGFHDFCELRVHGVLGSSLPASTKSVSNNSTLGGCAQYLMVAILDAQEPEV